MVLIDVNVLIRAHRPDAERHREYSGWLRGTLDGDDLVAVSDQVLSSVIRIVTNPRVFPVGPTPLHVAIEFVEELRQHLSCVAVSPGGRHWQIFTQLCRATEARGNLITDAWFAAMAIESGAELITADRDYARFPGLRWRHPLAAS